MSSQQFSQALNTEHFLIVSCPSYRPPEDFIRLIQSLETPNKTLCIALPYASFMKNRDQLSSLHIWKGLTDIPSVDPHTFTAPVAIRLAKDAGIDFAIIGDFTSRHVLYETDHSIAAKLRHLLEAQITPVVCFGETLQEYFRGSTTDVIKEQLSALLLGLTFEQMIKTVLVYKAPWLNTIAPEHFTEEYNKSHQIVLEALKQLFGNDAATHIFILTDLPLLVEDFSKIDSNIPPSGYFLEMKGKGSPIIAGYFDVLTDRNVKNAPPLHTQTVKSKPTKEADHKEQKLSEKIDEPKKPKKASKPRKKKDASFTEVSEVYDVSEMESTTEHEEHLHEDHPIEESLHETILSVEHELESPTIHFEANEPTAMSSVTDEDLESVTTTEEEFVLEWYSNEELDALRKEFGIQSDGSIKPKPLPVWDNTRPVRIIKTQAQKAEQAAKPGKSSAKSKKTPKKSS